MELAIATDYLGESPCLDETEKRLERIAKAGFSHVHWAHEWNGDYIYSIHEMDWIHRTLKKYGLKVKGIHASQGSIRSDDFFQNFHRNDQMRKDYSSLNEYSRKAGVDLIKNRIDMAVILETKEIVLHMIQPCCDFGRDGYEEQYYHQIFKSLDELKEYCMNRNVRICIENMWAPNNEMQIRQFDRIFQRYGSEFLGICIDTGHALLADEKRNALELAERYMDRIFCIHAQDNIGPDFKKRRAAKTLEESCKASGPDLHRIPFDGIFDWERFSAILANSPYELPIVLETVCKEENEMDFLQKNIAAGRKITEMVEKGMN